MNTLMPWHTLRSVVRLAIALAACVHAACGSLAPAPVGGTASPPVDTGAGNDLTASPDATGAVPDVAPSPDGAVDVPADGAADAPELDAVPPADTGPVDKEAPTVAFKNVFNGTKVSGKFTVEVDAADDIGVVSVQYTLNGTPVETVIAASWSWAWDSTAFASGNWFLAAVAKDASGKSSEPAVAEIVLNNKADACGQPPKVKLVYPTDKVVVCGDLTIETAASGPCGVAKVEFFIDDKKMGEGSEKPFKTPWKTAQSKDGPHFVKAVATDSAKQQGQQTIVVQVNNKQTQCVNPPTVFVTKPSDDSYVFGKVPVEAESAAGGDVATIVEVLFSVDGSSVGKASVSPWQTTWDSDAKTEGPHTLKAIAKDNFDKLGVHQITVTVDRTPPTVKFVAPDDFANVNGDEKSVTVAADAADNLALGSVAFTAKAQKGGGAAKLGSVKGKPWQVEWKTQGQASGDWTLEAVASDAAGHTTVAKRTVVLDRPPTLSVSMLDQGESALQGKVNIGVGATDDLGLGLGAPSFKLDGAELTLKAKSTQSPTSKFWFYDWDTTEFAFGDHAFHAVVEDTGGHKATATLKVKVDQPLLVKVDRCDKTWNGCSLAQTANKKLTGKLYLQVTAKDDNAEAAKMELLIDGQGVATLPKAPWQFIWDSATVKDGDHDLAVKVTTTLPATGSVEFSVKVNNCDLDGDKHLALGGACGGDDCNDGNANVYPGAVDMAGEITADKLGQDGDQNCDGLDGVDADGDKVASIASGGKDCDDTNAKAYPCADELAGAATDTNCDGKLAPSCDDCSACSTDALVNAKCVHTPIGEGSGCDDGSACTLGEVCKGGVCGGSTAKNCDDANLCTADACDAVAGCANTGVGDGGACDLDASKCAAGVCEAGAPDGMVLIAAGSFKMGCVPGDGDCYDDEAPQHSVTLDAYYMDVHEVTVAKYQACVAAGKCVAPGSSGYCSPSQYGTYDASGKTQHPVNCVTWSQADAYCKWTDAKAYLPSEAQWEKAARGGLDSKKFPWGDAGPTCTPGKPNTAVWASGVIGCGKGGTWAVGTGSSKNGYGLYDMSGNVWEWVSDWYSSSYYGASPATNPPGPGSGSSRVVRSGSCYNDYPAGLRASKRFDIIPSVLGVGLGFRCSRSFP
ncbi:MAG: hypothetical protein EXR79_16750 [Myxococcales bacterium]|nr:hypothetical protein [Myxococcales bacterium]